MHPLRPLHGGLPRAGHRAGRAPQAHRQRAPGNQGNAGRCLQRLSRDRSAHGPRLRLYRLRHVQSRLPQRGHHPRAQRRNRQAEIPHQHGRSAPPARRTSQQPGKPSGPDQVRAHLHAHRPGTRCRTPRIRTADPPGPDPARRRGPPLLERKRMDTARPGDLSPSDRQHVLRGPFAHHVGGAADGCGLSQRGTGHARADVHRRGRLPAEAVALAFHQVRHPADRQRLLRLGRDYPRPSRDEGRPLRHRDQVRPGSQARRRRAF